MKRNVLLLWLISFPIEMKEEEGKREKKKKKKKHPAAESSA